MTDSKIESLPTFSPPAEKLWAAIPIQSRKLLLANVWCGRCCHAVTIKNFSGVVKAGDLLLVGECSECHGDVARLIETSQQPKS
ncbi:MAG: hypothetical protein WC742_04900 [Gallionellaceae bacterium]|jgi:hypothetical protein